MKKNRKQLLASLLPSLLLVSPFAHGTPASSPDSAPDSARIACFEFKKSDTPAAINLDSSAALKTQKWCYQKKNYGQQKAIFIFNADSASIKPELTAMVWLNEMDQPVSMSVGSLAQSKIKFQSLPDLSLNPFAVPLHPALAAVTSTKNLDAAVLPAASNPNLLDEVSNQHWLFAAAPDDVTVQAGDFNYSVN
jgi:hypothetical protein